MPVKINRYRETKVVELPSGASATVEIGKPSAGDLAQATGGESAVEMTFAMLASRIKSWDYIDENDQPLEISGYNIRFIPTDDYAKLVSFITVSDDDEVSDAENLTSSATLTETKTADQTTSF